MPTRARPTVWTPKGRTERFPKRVYAPIIRTYTAPPLPPQMPKRTVFTLENDPDSVAMLESLIEQWLAEAARLEATVGDFTLPEKLARLMFQVDVPMKIKQMEKEWDPNGGGLITLGEFRQHVKALGIEAPVDEIDGAIPIRRGDLRTTALLPLPCSVI